ncbi:MAG: dethiobiotin synthase [Steroidobacteraceae bacterium]
MKPCGVFIAGTDTAVGKTRISAGLLGALRARGLRVAGMKPVAAGAIRQDGRLISADAVILADNSQQDTPYEWLNPYALELAESPHLGADESGIQIDLAVIRRAYALLAARHEWVVVEGAGGWFSPIGANTTMADIALALELPVLLVVGLRLGCLNHALLTAGAIRASGLKLAGWIGSTLQHPWSAASGNVEALTARLGMAPLAVLPWSESTAADQPRLAPAAAALLA